MWGNLSIGKKLAVSFGTVVTFAVLLGVVAWNKVDNIGSGWNDFESVTLAKRNAVTQGQVGLMNGIHHFKNYILRAGDYDKKFREDMAAIAKAMADYRSVGRLDAEEEKSIGQIEQGVQAYLAAIDQAVKARGEGLGATDIDRSIKGADKALGDALAVLMESNAARTRDASAGFKRVVVSAAW